VTFLDNEKKPNKTRNAHPKKSQCIEEPNLQKKTRGPTKGGQANPPSRKAKWLQALDLLQE
jgi:hypothetical protein